VARIPQLDGLRALAILMVFAGHAFHIPLLWTGVDLFFVLSGYLITGILLRLKEQPAAAKYFAPFYKRRARRILPPYFVFLIAAGLLFSLPWARGWYWYIFFATNVPLALGQTGAAALMPLWSLAVEEQFYLVWPWVVLCCSRESLRKAAVATVVLSPLIRAAATPLFSSHLPIYCLTIFRADTLAAGAFLAIAQAEDGNWIVRRRHAGLYALLGAGMLLVLLGLRPEFRTSANSILFNSVGYSLTAIAFAGTLTYVLALERGIVYEVLTCKASRYLGRISYTFYLYHLAILEKTATYVSSPLARAVIGFVLTFAVAAVSWHWLESRILNLSLASWEKRVLPAFNQPSTPSELRSELS
jgi:peptidoglycan/LPS O-acetylase OafA/YrhL